MTIGPALEEGFYYDCFMGERTLHEDDKGLISKTMNNFIKEKQNFERVVVSREEARGRFMNKPKMNTAIAQVWLICLLQKV